MRTSNYHAYRHKQIWSSHHLQSPHWLFQAGQFCYVIKKAERSVAPGTCVLDSFSFFHYHFFCLAYAEKYSLLEDMSNEFYNSQLVSVFFAPPMGWILLRCFLKSFSSILADITFNTSSSFVSPFSDFWRPHKYHAWSSRVWTCFI